MQVIIYPYGIKKNKFQKANPYWHFSKEISTIFFFIILFTLLLFEHIIQLKCRIVTIETRHNKHKLTHEVCGRKARPFVCVPYSHSTGRRVPAKNAVPVQLQHHTISTCHLGAQNNTVCSFAEERMRFLRKLDLCVDSAKSTNKIKVYKSEN